MDCVYTGEVGDGVNYDSVNCKGCCTGGRLDIPKNKKHVRFSDDVGIIERNKHCVPENQKFIGGICACCKDTSGESECGDFGRPVLLYEIPSPKFNDATTHKRDFGPKPLPYREIPPWHPILKDRWKRLDVPSFNKSTYQRDFTPQVAIPEDKKECLKSVYLAPKKKRDRCQELLETFQTWRKTSEGPTQDVCDKPVIVETVVRTPKTKPSPEQQGHLHFMEGEERQQQVHGPECEKHCSSSPLRCHVGPPKSNSEEHYDSRVTGHEHTLSHNQACHEAAPVCVTKDNLLQPDASGYHSCDSPRQLNDGSNALCNTIEGHPSGDRQDCCVQPERPVLLDIHDHKHGLSRQQACHTLLPENSSHAVSANKCISFDVPKCPSEQSAEFRTGQGEGGNCDCSPGPRSAKLGHGPKRSSSKFTLCEREPDNNCRYWWKMTGCESQREDTTIGDVPEPITKPCCPSYLTMYKRDYREPATPRHEECKDLREDCGCKSKRFEKGPKFERGGLI